MLLHAPVAGGQADDFGKLQKEGRIVFQQLLDRPTHAAVFHPQFHQPLSRRGHSFVDPLLDFHFPTGIVAGVGDPAIPRQQQKFDAIFARNAGQATCLVLILRRLAPPILQATEFSWNKVGKEEVQKPGIDRLLHGSGPQCGRLGQSGHLVVRQDG
jgi:hypothetical protein